MKTTLLESKRSIRITPTIDALYVLVPEDKVDIRLTLQKKDLNIRFVVLYSLKEDENVNLFVQVVHKVPGTRCAVDIKGALFGNSKSDCEGKITVEERADQTISSLDDKVLSIGKRVRNVSKPTLEIMTDDVKVSHGAASGKIDKNQLYYLMSRGLSEKEAQSEIVRGFFEAEILGIKNEKIMEEVRKRLNV
jgi:Fe-S cluster assembly protein SufD